MVHLYLPSASWFLSDPSTRFLLWSKILLGRKQTSNIYGLFSLDQQSYRVVRVYMCNNLVTVLARVRLWGRGLWFRGGATLFISLTGWAARLFCRGRPLKTKNTFKCNELNLIHYFTEALFHSRVFHPNNLTCQLALEPCRGVLLIRAHYC